ncbi:cytochrome c maturation protein CcmE [Spirochaeta africana]|uniref:OB-fold nucleic acid binding protein n=1 Tax=Spirochaeta africana (strain ATCC 700263 / DSM 8902 / Z-7692) TaxID=889378 RepID=H9UIV2_SPIAZ|nr:cytochrome c maturation protein CcmE [Spirochaeta africana]AFG37445.1 hypothetical protein Spiaf_1379 [Spirochaeta africana DSM 8902]
MRVFSKSIIVFLLLSFINVSVSADSSAEVFTIQRLLRDGYNRAGEEVQVYGVVSDIRKNDAGEIQGFSLRDGRYSASVIYNGTLAEDLFNNGDALIIRFELTMYNDNLHSITLGKWGAIFNPEYNIVAFDADRPTDWSINERRTMPFDITVEEYTLEAYRYGNELVRVTGRVRSKEVARIFGGQERNLYLHLSSPGQRVEVHVWERHWPNNWNVENIEEQLNVGSLIRITGSFNQETSMGVSFLASEIEVIE